MKVLSVILCLLATTGAVFGAAASGEVAVYNGVANTLQPTNVIKVTATNTAFKGDVTLNNLGATGAVTAASATVNDDPYDGTTWNGSTNVPTKNALRDKIESLTAAGGTTNEPGWYIANSNGMVADNSTDNSAAFTSLINTAIGGAKTNVNAEATIQLGAGIYKFTSAPSDFGQGENCIVPIPRKSATSISAGMPLLSKLRIRGVQPFSAYGGSSTTGTPATNGTVLYVTSTNAGVFLSSIGFAQAFTNNLQFNVTVLEFENIQFRAPTNSHMTMIGGSKFFGVVVRDCGFVHDQYMSGSIPPPRSLHTAIYMPGVNCSWPNEITRVSIDGYDIGTRLSEHAKLDLVDYTSCNIGLFQDVGNYWNSGGKLGFYGCITNIWNNGGKIYIQDYSAEALSASSWRDNIYDYASGNNGRHVIYGKRINDADTSLNSNFKIGSTEPGRFWSLDNPGMWNAQSTENLGQRGIYGVRYSGDAIGTAYGLFKGRGTFGAPAVPNSGDFLGFYAFGGYDGATKPGIATAYMAAQTTGSASSGNIPTKIVFAAGNTSSPTNSMEISANGLNIINPNIAVAKTITAGGTTGNQTINKTAGSVNFAAAAQTLTVTNSYVATSSVIFCTLGTDDATAKSAVAVAASGQFTITLNASATAETRVNFVVLN